MMALKIGVIAEEVNDVEVLYAVTCRYVQENQFSLKRFVGHGCGKLRRKCRSWAENLLRSGCTYLVVIHDLDTWNAKHLRSQLTALTEGVAFKGQIILLPKREIEAWLLTDAEAIRRVFNITGTVRLPNHPEDVNDPKKALRDLVRPEGKIYLNTVHNKRIAEESNVEQIYQKCESYRPYPSFLGAAFGI